MSQIVMKLFVILAIFIPLAAAEYYVTGYSDNDCQLTVSTISCSQAWGNCAGFGSWINSFTITRDADDPCSPPQGRLFNMFSLSFGCSGDDGYRGGGCGNPSTCQVTASCNGDNCTPSAADSASCNQV